MRVIGSLTSQKEAEHFSSFLKQQDICNQWEEDKKNTLDLIYTIWVYEEDQIEKAISYLNDFKKNPLHANFYLTSTTPPPFTLPTKNKSSTQERHIRLTSASVIPLTSTPITLTTVLICIILFLASSNIHSLLMFDLAMTSSSWSGIYPMIKQYILSPHSSSFHFPPLFTLIRQGEIWRLFTPVLLHGSFLHILMNMLWVILLGKHLEVNLGILRYLLIILLTAVISNVAQYMMTGPAFLGYSGVICGMLAFIWVRQKKYPWEGYLVSSSTIQFVAFFVFAMLGLQIASFYLEVYQGKSINLGIANTAHIVGGITGALLGSSSFFNAKKR